MSSEVFRGFPNFFEANLYTRHYRCRMFLCMVSDDPDMAPPCYAKQLDDTRVTIRIKQFRYADMFEGINEMHMMLVGNFRSKNVGQRLLIVPKHLSSTRYTKHLFDLSNGQCTLD
jgi:hypothetical protein